MPSGLSSPRSRGAALADMGERSTFVARQRVGRPKRPRPGRRARLRRLFHIALTVAVVAAARRAAIHWVLTTPRFAVASVEVRGVSRVPPDQILAVAAIPRGTNIFKLDTIGVTGRVESLPEVRRADVVRELPNRVVISVEERRPFTLVHGGRLHWVDEGGRLLRASPPAGAPPLPVLSRLSRAQPPSGAHPARAEVPRRDRRDPVPSTQRQRARRRDLGDRPEPARGAGPLHGRRRRGAAGHRGLGRAARAPRGRAVADRDAGRAHGRSPVPRSPP